MANILNTTTNEVCFLKCARAFAHLLLVPKSIEERELKCRKIYSSSQ